MELHQDTPSTPCIIQSYEPGQLIIGQKEYNDSVVFTPTILPTAWRPGTADAITTADINALAQHQPSIVLLGTGNHHLRLPDALFTELRQANIGIEIMSTAAACRTFTLLAADQRSVLAAVIIE